MLRKRGDLRAAYALFEPVEQWKALAVAKAREMFVVNRRGPAGLQALLKLLQEYAQGVYMATDYIQAIWSESPDAEYLVDKMYHYLYGIYPPMFPPMIEKIDAMSEQDIEEYFNSIEQRQNSGYREEMRVPVGMDQQVDDHEPLFKR